MKKKTEVLKNKNFKQKLIEYIENESNEGIKLIESKNTIAKEEFSIPIYIDLEEYSNEKLNDILEENQDEVLDGLKEDDYINTLSMIFFDLSEKEIKVNFKISNRDSDGEECLNIIIEY